MAVDSFTLRKFIKLHQNSIERTLHILVSFAILISIVSALIFLRTSNLDWSRNEFLKHGWKYVNWLFTFWISGFQVIYFNIYSVIDIINIYSKEKPSLKRLKDHLHYIASYLLFAFVFPFTLLVAILFWMFYYTRRESIYPDFMDELFPPLLNHIAHTFPIIVVIIYMYTSNKYEPPKTQALAGLLALLAVYSAVLLMIKQRDGRWVYLALETLTTFERRCLFTFCIVGSISFLFLGYEINKKVKVIGRY